ncbi:hypothetical protein MOE86_11965 [Bacillus atrophaeus]|nr:hypothetical protein [Bacillus atrophaeus]MCY9197413.1 hypothetical protein [Bacillus atrophaeus]
MGITYTDELPNGINRGYDEETGEKNDLLSRKKQLSALFEKENQCLQ